MHIYVCGGNDLDILIMVHFRNSENLHLFPIFFTTANFLYIRPIVFVTLDLVFFKSFNSYQVVLSELLR